MEDERTCEGCGMRSTDYWQCPCEVYVTQRDEAAREADKRCEHGSIVNQCSACMYAANE